MTKDTTVQTGGDQDIALLKKASLQSMRTWYDQQLTLAKKSKYLAHLKADIAKFRFEETFALVK